MESLTPRTNEAEAETIETVTEASTTLATAPARELAATLHPRVLTMFVVTYGAMLALLWLVFGTDIIVLITLGVCTVYFAMYFGIPIAMNRLADKSAPPANPGPFRRFLDGDVDTNTGPVSGWGAIAQLMTIPVGLVFAFIALGVIVKLGS